MAAEKSVRVMDLAAREEDEDDESTCCQSSPVPEPTSRMSLAEAMSRWEESQAYQGCGFVS